MTTFWRSVSFINKRLWMRLVRSQSGMSLVELMVVVAIMGVVALGTATLLSNLSNQLAFSAVKAESIQLQSSIESALRSSISCYQNMQTNSIVLNSSRNLTSLHLFDMTGSSVAVLVPGLNVGLPGEPRLQVTSMELTAPSNPTSPPSQINATATTRNFTADLLVHLRYPGGPGLRPLAIRGMNIQTNLSGVVTSCKVGAVMMCVTGRRNGSTGTNTVDHADAGFSGGFSTVFNVIASGGQWGLECKPGWSITGCRGSNLRESSVSTDATLLVTGHSCQTPNSSAVTGMNSSLLLTCCSSL